MRQRPLELQLFRKRVEIGVADRKLHLAAAIEVAPGGFQVDGHLAAFELAVADIEFCLFAGHDHVYERIKPQNGIHYFVSGAAGQLRRGNMRPTNETAAFFDQDQSFMLVEVAGNELSFAAVSRTGKTVDSGVIKREPAEGRGNGR